MIRFLAEQAQQTACQPNQWVELLHDWGWGILFICVLFALAISDRLS